jgi:hypothetical protein
MAGGIDQYQAQIEGVKKAANAPEQLKSTLNEQVLVKAVNDSQAEIEDAAKTLKNPAARAYLGKIRSEIPPILFRIAQEGIAVLQDNKKLEAGVSNINSLVSQLSSALEAQKQKIDEYRKYEVNEKDALELTQSIDGFKKMYDEYDRKSQANAQKKKAGLPEEPLNDLQQGLIGSRDLIKVNETELRGKYASTDSDVQALYDRLWQGKLSPAIETYKKTGDTVSALEKDYGVAHASEQILSSRDLIAEAAKKDKTGVVTGLADIFKSGGLVDEFQKLDEHMNLEGSVEAQKYLASGKRDVAQILGRIKDRSDYLVNTPADKIGTGPGQQKYESGENIEQLASGLRTAINAYKAKLAVISSIVGKRKEAFNLLTTAYSIEASAEVANAAPFIPPVFIKAIDDALYGPDGSGGCMAVNKLLRNNTDLPKEFVQEMLLNIDEKQTTRLLEVKIRGQQRELIDTQKLGPDLLSKFVVVNEQQKPGDLPYAWTEAGRQLTPEQQETIILALTGVRETNYDQVEAATCPKATERYWAAKALFESGQFQAAKKTIEAFIKEDISAIAVSSDPKLKDKADVYKKNAEDLLAQIDKVDGASKDFFTAQELAQSGDIIGAKKLLKKYLAEHKEKKEGETDFTGSATELLKRIALVQFKDAREKFFEYNKRPPEKIQRNVSATASRGGVSTESVDNPDYAKWMRYAEALVSIEREINSGKYLDFTDAYNAVSAEVPGGFDAKDEMNMLADQLILDRGREGLLELARKYRERGKFFGDPKFLALAEQYFQEYFSKKLAETATKYVSIEDLRKKYYSNPSFHAGITDRVSEAKKQYDEKAAKDPEWAKKNAWNESNVRILIENQAFAKMQGEETVKMQNDLFKIDPKNSGDMYEQAVWSEFADMKGLEPFSLSDEQVGRLVKDLPVDIAMIAAAGALAAATGGAASGLALNVLLTSAERQAMKMGARFVGRELLAAAVGFGVETAMFTASHSVLNSLRTGELSIASFDQFMVEWGENVKVMGVLGMAGRASAALKLGRVSSLGVELSTMGTMHGKLTVDDLAMVLGLKGGHALPGVVGKVKRAGKGKPALKTAEGPGNLGPYRNKPVEVPEAPSKAPEVRRDAPTVPPPPLEARREAPTVPPPADETAPHEAATLVKPPEGRREAATVPPPAPEARQEAPTVPPPALEARNETPTIPPPPPVARVESARPETAQTEAAKTAAAPESRSLFRTTADKVKSMLGLSETVGTPNKTPPSAELTALINEVNNGNAKLNSRNLKRLATHPEGIAVIRENMRSGRLGTFENLPRSVKKLVRADTKNRLFESFTQGDPDRIKEFEKNYSGAKLDELLSKLEKHKPPEGYENLPKMADILYSNADNLDPMLLRQVLNGEHRADYHEMKVFENGVEKTVKTLSFTGGLIGEGGFADVMKTIVFDSPSTKPHELVVKSPRLTFDFMKLPGLELMDGAKRARLEQLVAEFQLNGVHEPKGYEKFWMNVLTEFKDYRFAVKNLEPDMLRYQASIDEVANSKRIMEAQSRGELDYMVRIKYVDEGGNIYMESLANTAVNNQVADLHSVFYGNVKSLDGVHPISRQQLFGGLARFMDDLADMHDRGLEHRDIKPENIAFRPDGSIAILDPGSMKTAADLKNLVFGNADLTGNTDYAPHLRRPGVRMPVRGGISDSYYDDVVAYSEATGTPDPNGVIHTFGAHDRSSVHFLLNRMADRPAVSDLMTGDEIITFEDVVTEISRPNADLRAAARKIRETMGVN